LAEQFDIGPTIDSTFPLENYEDAFERLNLCKVMGKDVMILKTIILLQLTEK